MPLDWNRLRTIRNVGHYALSVNKHILLLRFSNEEIPKQLLNVCMTDCQSTRTKANFLVDYVLDHPLDLVAMSET